MMGIPPYTSIVAGLQRSRSTDLDRYVRTEFGTARVGGSPTESERIIRSTRTTNRASPTTTVACFDA